MSSGNAKQVSYGVVIPTLGMRPEFFFEAISSCKQSKDIYVLVCGPLSSIKNLPGIELADQLDTTLEGISLEEKIREAFGRLPETVRFVSWLGDDDMLNVEGALGLVSLMEENQSLVLGYGNCTYIDAQGKALFSNSPGPRGVLFSSFGPQTVSQPSTIYRKSALLENNVMSSEMTLAFDLHILLSLKKYGQHVYIDREVSCWRWHAGSATVGKRAISAWEALQVRATHRGKFERIVFLPLDILVGLGIFLTGSFLNLVFRRMSKGE